MAESNDVQAIERISAVVGESQIKIIFSNQCIKAQTLLVNRLKKQFQRQKEISKFISTDNLKLEAEIQNAEQGIKSLMLAHESIKSANVELNKEWQLAKERTQETAERILFGEKKYDELWDQCKSRYESIEFVQNWLQAKKKAEDLTQNIHSLEREIQGLFKEHKTKHNIIEALNKKRIIELAEYVINEKPKIIENIKGTQIELKELNNQLEHIQKIQTELSKDKHKADFTAISQQIKSDHQKMSNAKIDNDWPYLNNNFSNNADTMIPKLQLMSFDLDLLSVKLDQIKKYDLVITSHKKEIPQANAATGETGPKIIAIDKKHDDYISCYFTKALNESNNADGAEENNCNYSTRKLINILEDIKIDKTEACNLVSKVNLDNIHEVYNIGTNAKNDSPPEFVNEKDNHGAQEEEIEVIDVASSNCENILLPPSSFLDQFRSSQEKKKKVSFELPTTLQELTAEAKKSASENDVVQENEANVTINSPLEVSSVSDESFSKIKDMILKKHNLDLSPQFFYAKNTVLQKNEDTEVKSNYFNLGGEEVTPSISGSNYEREQAKIIEIMEVAEIQKGKPTQSNGLGTKDESIEMKVAEDDGISSIQVNQDNHRGKQVTGLLFSHGAQGLPESLDVSISTTGFEDGDADFPQYSSLLLSPKADLPIPTTSDKCEITSQEVPNFLSGLRKTGLSIFEKIAGENSNNTDAAHSGGNNFNFAFGSDDKKNRGGIFNMFN